MRSSRYSPPVPVERRPEHWYGAPTLVASNADFGYGITVDTVSPAFNGPNVVVVGQTCSHDFPAYNAFQTMVEPCVAFVTKLDNGLHIATPTYGNAPGSPIVAIGSAPCASVGTPPTSFPSSSADSLLPPSRQAFGSRVTTYPPGAIIQDANFQSPTSNSRSSAAPERRAEPQWQTSPLTFTYDGGPATGIYLGKSGPRCPDPHPRNLGVWGSTRSPGRHLRRGRHNHPQHLLWSLAFREIS